jgi:hypothetical protein
VEAVIPLARLREEERYVMRRVLLSRLGLFVCVFLLVVMPLALWGCGGGVPTATMESTPENTATVPVGVPTAATEEKVVQVGATEHYTVTLRLGSAQQMVPPEEAASGTPGEVMVTGTMPMAIPTAGMSSETPTYHVEVAVNDIAGGAVVTDKSVSLDLTYLTTNEKISVPLAAMYDAKIGPSDTHFGGNVALTPGNYRADIDVGGEKVTINTTAPFVDSTPFTMGGGTPTP